MSAELKKILAVQAALLEKMGRGPTLLEADPVSLKTKAYFQAKTAAANNAMEKFETNHLNLFTETSENERGVLKYFTDRTAETMETIHITYLNALSAAFDRLYPDIESIHNSTFNGGGVPNHSLNETHLPAREPKLPTVDLPKFNGTFTDWRTFHSQFKEIIHENVRLSPVHKFHYLRGAVTGEAFDVISDFAVTADDYPQAWQALENRYNDDSQLFSFALDRFMSLPKLSVEDSEQLRSLLKHTKTCIKALEDLRFDSKHFESIIAYIVLQKLPSETVAYWESIREKKTLPKIQSISDCIDVRIRMAAAVSKHQSTASSEKQQSREIQQSNQSMKRKKVNAHLATPKSSSSTNASVVSASSSNNAKSAGKKFECPVCHGEGHPLRTCERFLALRPAERKSTVIKLKYCVNCLSFDHQDQKCKSSHTCFTCGERHHSLLHIATTGSTSHVSAHTLVSEPAVSSHAVACNAQTAFASSPRMLLATAVVTILDMHGTPHALRALIDQGSEANFITESALSALKLPKQAVQAVINGIGSSSGRAKYIASLTIQSQHDRTFSVDIEALVMGRITSLLPSNCIQPQRWDHITDLTLADPSYHRTGRIDLVLGVDVLAQILMQGVRIGPTGTPIAQQTHLGWILSGKISNETARNISVTSLHTTSNIETLMNKFMAVESVEDASPLTNEEQWCEQFFVDTHRRDETGRFIVRLPFRSLFDPSVSSLGRSRDIAVKRLLGLERRLAQNPDLKREYVSAINEYITHGRMQPTTSTEIDRDGVIRAAYLPHHAVIKESSTSTKLRVVFDASRKTTSGNSLNEMLISGPTIQNDIVTILINWRFHRIGCTADVQKMYLQVKVDPRDVEYQRIVWRNDPSEPIRDFAMNRLTFGTSCAPFIAIRCVNQLAEDEILKYPDASIVMTKDTYVDDVISGGDDVPAVQKLQRELSEMMRSGGFELKKWASNVSEVLEMVPESDRELKLPVELNSNDTIKALGIIWNPATDSFHFKSSLESTESRKPHTKRTALSTIAKLFDPIGLIAPIIVVAKIFLKRVWMNVPALDWDDSLPSELRDKWTQYIEQLQHVTEIKIPRWVNTSKKNISFQLHGFCDASSMAYGAAVYIRTVDENNKTHIHLVASKSKVAPNKTMTIPRLELCGALLLAKLLSVVRNGFRHACVSAEDIVLWCDSEIVCYWLRSTKPLKVFVGNRVNQIHEFTPGIRWRHVRTHDNPADLVSRGVSPAELAVSSLWWHGPNWLQTPAEEWPTSNIDLEHPPKDSESEIRRIVQSNVCVASNDIIERFSSYNRLIRVTAWCKRFRFNASHSAQRKIGHLHSEELKSALRHWVLETQQQHYYNEIQCLIATPPEELPHRSKLLSLTPFIDGNGIMRMNGRLENSLLPYDEIHPIILPPSAHFTRLLIDRVHQRTLHGGTQLMLAAIRRQFWIVNARNAVRHRIHKCITCYRHKVSTTRQLMGSLPSARVQRTIRPFLHVGVDYCGPFEVRASKYRGNTAYKGYIAVFVCMTVKAVHIECVDGLTTEAFLAAFRRFVSRRGLPSDVYSDNGTNFVGAANQLNRDFKQAVQTNELNAIEFIANDNVQWHFLPPASPHMGGIWERSVRSVKHHLRRVIGESKLTFEAMSTLLCQIEACLNSRPLCATTNDPNDLAALTPAHFLVGTDLVSVPEPTLLDANTNRLNKWQQIQQLRQSFWKRWRNDYLSQLQQRPKWQNQQPNLNVGELVLVQNDQLPSFKWPLGRITATYPGDDGFVRVVTVRTASGTYKRNITRICRLPMAHDDVEHISEAENEEDPISA